MVETNKHMTSINFENDQIVDSGCNYFTSDSTKFNNIHQYEGNDVIITSNNTIHQMEKEGIVIISNKDNDPITNAVDDENYVHFYPIEIRFLRNIKELDTYIIYYGKRAKDLLVLSALTTYVDKMSSNDSASI